MTAVEEEAVPEEPSPKVQTIIVIFKVFIQL